MSGRFDLDDFLPYRLAVLAGRISREFQVAYQEAHGLSRAEWRVLAHLSQETAVSIREIHVRVDMDKSKVSRAATRLEQAGLVTKRVHDLDKRLIELSLTDRGIAIMAGLAPVADAYQAELLARLGPDADTCLRCIEALGVVRTPK